MTVVLWPNDDGSVIAVAVDAKMPRTIGRLQPKLNILMLESESDALVSDIKCLNSEIANNGAYFRLALVTILEERVRMLDLLINQVQISSAFERDDSLIAQAVLAAQNRVK